MIKWFFHILIVASLPAVAQDSIYFSVKHTDSTTLSKRKWMVGGASVLAYGGSFIFLNEAWYKDYPRARLHSFNDAGEWKQMDKIGHGWTAYHTSRANTALWQWAGLSEKKSILIGTATSMAYMLGIEWLDGHSAEWGWSWPDAGADLFGAALFATQQLAWKEQKIGIKFSSHRNTYTPAALEQRADVLFGKSLSERVLKDYNAQTYWLSFNLKSLFHIDQMPSWLNLGVGFGADGMFGGYENIARDKENNIIFDRRDIQRYRQWYLSPDIDLTKIKTKSAFLKTTFFILNAIKIPAPALELSNGKLKGHWISF